MRTLLVVLLVIVGSLVGLNYYHAAHPREINYITDTARRTDITENVPVTGFAEPIMVRNVQAEILGTVEEVLVDYNEAVKKGQVLLRLSDDIQRVELMGAKAKLLAAEVALPTSEAAVLAAEAALQSADAYVRAANAGLTAAEADLSAATREYETARQNVEKNIIPKSKADSLLDQKNKAEAQVQEALSKIEQAKAGRVQAEYLAKQAQAGKRQAVAQIEAAKVGVEAAELNLKKCELQSTMDGIVLNKDVRVGDTVGRPKVSLTDGAGAIFEIAAPLDHMRAIVKVSEADYSRVRVGQIATFSVDAYPNEKFTANVMQVRYAPTAERTAVSYATELQFDNRKDSSSGEWMVKPRSTVSADIKIREARGVLAVPNSALLFTPSKFNEDIPGVNENERIVWSLGPEKTPVPRKIAVGITDGITTEVVGGDLKEGDTVITGQPEEQKRSFRLPFAG